MAPEIDYFEISTDSGMQSAYVTNASLRSNADIDDEDMADITDWTDSDSGAGVSSQVTFDSKECMKLTNGTPVGGQAFRTRDIGTFGARTVVSVNAYFDLLGTRTAGDTSLFYIFDGSTRLMITFASDGIFVYDEVTWNEVGTNLVVQDIWQEWTFDINWTAMTVDVYLDKVLKATGVDCSSASATANGTVWLIQNGDTIANCITYIDWLKAGSDLYCPLQSYSEATIKTQGSYALKAVAAITDSLNKTLTKTFSPALDLSGVNTVKLDMGASRTGANVKLGLRNGVAGLTTELTPTIATADTYQTVSWDLSGVADSDKNSIDQFVITIVNAAAANTIYFDFFGIRISANFTATVFALTLTPQVVTYRYSISVDEGVLNLTLWSPFVKISSTFTDTAQALTLGLGTHTPFLDTRIIRRTYIFGTMEQVTATKLNNFLDTAIWEISNQVAGDMFYFDGDKWMRLPKGTNGQVLKMVDGLPEWA